jgi:hypothetical protein
VVNADKHQLFCALGHTRKLRAVAYVPWRFEGPAMKELFVLLLVLSLSAGTAVALTYQPSSTVVNGPNYSGASW